MIASVDAHRTTIAVQRYLDELAGAAGGTPAEPVVRALLARSVDRLHFLCGSLLHRQYPRLTRGPSNLNTEELLGGVVERLIKAMREVRPATVRHFFALANRHVRWELNDLARRLDHRGEVVGLDESYAAAPRAASDTGVTGRMRRMLAAVEALPEDAREAFNLVRIQGMTKGEAAAVLGVSEKTVKRRLSRCAARLTALVGDVVAGEETPPADPCVAAAASPEDGGRSERGTGEGRFD
jgi:RNA polymerase sigma-70 factor (ECF subfamily)